MTQYIAQFDTARDYILQVIITHTHTLVPIATP
jgi:hypothetical protein